LLKAGDFGIYLRNQLGCIHANQSKRAHFWSRDATTKSLGAKHRVLYAMESQEGRLNACVSENTISGPITIRL
jgi:hypothetical protein